MLGFNFFFILVNNEILVVLFKTFLFEDGKLTNHDSVNI